MKTRTKFIIGGVAAVAIAGIVLAFSRGRGDPEISIETVTVSRDNIQNAVTATGTVEPVDQVEVGTQVSGVVQHVYVDYNSQVRKGELIAELDKTTLRASLATAEANYSSAQTEVEYLEKNYNRISTLFEKELVSQEQMDKAKYDYDKAVASKNRTLAERTKAQTSLQYASIYSPIDGVVLARSIDEGQTVAASLNAPVLFTIARDLTKMQVEVDVDEADIGQVRDGQNAEFTVDAHTGQSFSGKVTQVRLEPTVTSNVVTYSVIVTTDNPDGLLMPGMTATISIATEEADDVVSIPAKALRFRPDRDMMREYMKSMGIKPPGRPGMGRSGMPGSSAPGSTSGAALSGNGAAHKGRAGIMALFGGEQEDGVGVVWQKIGEHIRPTRVKTGVTDGTTIEIIEGLDEGAEIVLAMSRGAAKTKSRKDTYSSSKSPFMPQRPGRKKK